MTLYELRQPIDKSYNLIKDLYKNISSEKLIDNIDDSNKEEKNRIFCVLIHRSWQALVNIVYSNKLYSLTLEDCYDIYLDALYYIVKTRPWNNPKNSLYKDKNAFIKAMMKCTYSRALNFIISQHRQKRELNTNTLSLNYMEEEFSDGYFIPYYDKYSSLALEPYSDIIKNQFNKKLYLEAFTLDALIFNDFYNEEKDFDIHKLRRYLLNIDNKDCVLFAERYDLNVSEAQHSIKYFKYLQRGDFNDKLNSVINHLKSEITEELYNAHTI